MHCAGREHLKNGMDYSRRKLGVVPAKVKDVPAFQSLVSVMQSAKEPCIGRILGYIYMLQSHYLLYFRYVF